MAIPAIVWRNPNFVQHGRVWNRAKRDACRSLYLIVEAVSEDQCKWKGLPNLEIIQGGAVVPARKAGQQQDFSLAT